MRDIFKTILPGWEGRAIPREFPGHVRVALFMSQWIVQIFALWYHRRPFGMLAPEKRTSLLIRLEQHSNHNIRNLVPFWKMVAFMTHVEN